MKIAVSIAVICLLLASCITKPQKGGRLSHSATNTTVEQGENPRDSSSHAEVKRLTTSMTVPAGTKVTLGASSFVAPYPIQVNINDEQSLQTVFGAAQEDTARKIGAVAKSLLPVLLVGLALFIGGGVLLYFSWFTPAWICFGMGIVAIVLYVTLPQVGAGWLLGFLGLAGAVTLVIFYAYKSGKNPEPEEETH